MLHFTTRDIIKRAKELADLENSNFITWSENMKLLDESYKKLYQEAINANDKYYLTRCETKDLVIAERKEKEVSFCLPEDFYQLQSISVKGSGKQILKKAKTEDNSSARYDIINNTLVLYGGSASLPLDIAYYPVPKTLTLKNDPVTVKINGTILDVNNDMVLSVDGDGNAIITNINTGWTKTIDISSITDDVEIGVLGATKFYLLTVNTTEYLCDIKTGTLTISDRFLGKKDGILYYTDFGRGTEPPPPNVGIYNEYGHELFSRSGIASYFLGSNYFSLDDDLNLYFFQNNQYPRIIKVDAARTVSEVKKFDTDEIHEEYTQWGSFQVIQDKLFYATGNVYCNETKLLGTNEYDRFIGFNKMDFDTGYGFTVTPLYEDNTIQIHSCFADTELDFPNNFYFSYLAYLLAIAYKQKQNADPALLLQRANDEYAQFLTSISRDVAETQRIQNVYGGGTYYYG